MVDVFTWIGTNWQMVVGVAGTVVMGASIMLHAVAPLTSTDKDDKAAGWLDRVYSWLSKVALNKATK